MPARRPLIPDEIPEHLRDTILWETQRYEARGNTESGAVIDQKCVRCGKIRTVSVKNLRRRGYGQFCGMCHSCYIHQQLENCAAWKGGRGINHDGYVWVLAKDHPARNSINRVAEHRLVMEQVLGRYLYPWESVHHINGDRQDNRPENLELWTRRFHINGIRAEDAPLHCPTCTCYKHKK